MIGLSLRRMDTAVQQQALLDGALRRVTFRQLLGPIVASLAIVTVLATQEFAVYEPTGISVVATEVRMVFDTGSVSSITNSIMQPNPSSQRAGFRSPEQAGRAAAAVVTAAPLLLATVVLAIIAGWGAARSSASETVQVGDWPPALDASPATVKITWFLIALNIGVPVVSLLASLSRFSPAIAWKQFSPLVGGALEVATAAALVALLAAMSSAGRWTRGLLAVSGASFLVGGQLLAIGMIRIFNHRWLDWIYNSGLLAVIAYAGRFGWIAIGAGRSTWSRPWKELRDVASVDGAQALSTAAYVIWPMAWPVLLAGGLMVGALSLTEVPATVLLMPQNPQVLTPTLMTWVHMVRYDAMIEASLLMMATVLLPAVAAVLLTGFGLAATRRGLLRPRG
jgi:ABC-type Fe3+ transport system permease subunit